MRFPCPNPSWPRWRTALLALLFGCIGGLLFAPVRHFGFINFDDPIYLETNPFLAQGLTKASAWWALTANLTYFSKWAEYWSPITLFSRLLDAQLFGMDPGAFHRSSAILHVANAIILFLALRLLTRTWWRSALVGALFLVHPLNIEPVAWLSARKDLLAGTFFFLTLAAYGHYAAAPSKKRYALVGLAFAGALMAKPMGITIPAVLLLLDFWPLRRWPGTEPNCKSPLYLLAEKLPLFLPAAFVAVLAVLSQKDWGALQSFTGTPLPLRLGNAILSYGLYLRRVFWPNDLAIYYPHPGLGLSWKAVEISAACLLLITLGVSWAARRHRFLIVGWLWFLGVLMPVIGLVQIGSQAMADRYAYPSAVGISIAVVWGAERLLKNQRLLGGALAAASLLALALASHRQLLLWRDSETAYRHALLVAGPSEMAYSNLGMALFERGDLIGARENFRKNLALRPIQGLGWSNLGAVERALGEDDVALAAYKNAIRIDPNVALSQFHAGKLYLKAGKVAEGEACLRRAIELAPDWAESYIELGTSLEKRGAKEESDSLRSRLLSLSASDPDAAKLLQKVK